MLISTPNRKTGIHVCVPVGLYWECQQWQQLHTVTEGRQYWSNWIVPRIFIYWLEKYSKIEYLWEGINTNDK